MPDAQPPTVGERLGLGPKWTPSTSQSWRWASMPRADGQKLWVLVINGADGVSSLTLTPEDMRSFAAKTLELSSGIVLPSHN